jgi:hypothetical protein
MSKDRNKAKKPDRKPKTKGKHQKGLPPHLQQLQDKSDSLREIQSHVDNLATKRPGNKNG